jgi:hypothetical protein
MTVLTPEVHIRMLQAELEASNASCRELAHALASMLKHIPTVEIEQHGGYRHAAALVDAVLNPERRGGPGRPAIRKQGL